LPAGRFPQPGQAELVDQLGPLPGRLVRFAVDLDFAAGPAAFERGKIPLLLSNGCRRNTEEAKNNGPVAHGQNAWKNKVPGKTLKAARRSQLL
jgi:hypothetical protein